MGGEDLAGDVLLHQLPERRESCCANRYLCAVHVEHLHRQVKTAAGRVQADAKVCATQQKRVVLGLKERGDDGAAAQAQAFDLCFVALSLRSFASYHAQEKRNLTAGLLQESVEILERSKKHREVLVGCPARGTDQEERPIWSPSQRGGGLDRRGPCQRRLALRIGGKPVDSRQHRSSNVTEAHEQLMCFGDICPLEVRRRSIIQHRRSPSKSEVLHKPIRHHIRHAEMMIGSLSKEGLVASVHGDQAAIWSAPLKDGESSLCGSQRGRMRPRENAEAEVVPIDPHLRSMPSCHQPCGQHRRHCRRVLHQQ
mmetsp:Transcript_19012/g.71919  ORF Transcript_19012/g.71919 Transcript_19012/m.71919 type:complete len:311 (-) Transcript_19012:268-1200(-)